MKSIISKLASTKREGIYWDFKREPHGNNAELLHDILCLSNSLHNGDRYLILGIADPSENCEIFGLHKEQFNRKSQAHLIDFLRGKSFAGGIRPEIELETISISDFEIDVIIIKNNPFKPYYLTSDYRDKGCCVKANHIYSRIGDTNTPIDSSADLHHVEKMWYQRFGFDLNPTDRFKLLILKDEEWFKDFGNTKYAYHKDFPEFRIEFSYPDEMWEPFCEFYLNKKGFLGKAEFKYELNTLFELTYFYCDEMRIIISEPKIKHVQFDNENQWFYYYDLSSWDGLFLRFLLGGQINFDSRGTGAPLLVFKNESEVLDFKRYLEINKEMIDSLNPDYVPRPSSKANDSVISLEFLCKAKLMYDTWPTPNSGFAPGGDNFHL